MALMVQRGLMVLQVLKALKVLPGLLVREAVWVPKDLLVPPEIMAKRDSLDLRELQEYQGRTVLKGLQVQLEQKVILAIRDLLEPQAELDPLVPTVPMAEQVLLDLLVRLVNQDIKVQPEKQD
jgi:hypothetical protein